MEFIWFAPLTDRTSDFGNPAFRTRFTDSPAALPGLIAGAEAAALIVDVSSDYGAQSAALVVDRWLGQLPVWILDPGATVASSQRWIKEGVSHVALDKDEIREQMLAMATTRAPQRRNRTPLIGESRLVRAVEDRIALVADRKCNVLIEGETGTGKEVTARAIHAGGSRAKGPWVAVNCGAIPEALLEAELFGYVKGAFTGAVQSRAGKFEAANRGTIFLDEIGDMPMSVQGKLLRVLQEREVERLGGNESVRLDVRVIAATNSNLAECVRKGTFRQDLYYRLSVYRIELPPLRERMGDVSQLASHFVAKVCAGERLPLKSLDPATLDRLMSHSWPGNVRELENTVEAAVIASGTRATVFPSDIAWPRSYDCGADFEASAEAQLPPDGMDFERVLQDFEKNILTQALNRTRGNKTAAANLLGLKRTTLAARMRALESRMPRLVA
jgi:transcriptional regulator with PAS, ATPase and Fis domain